MANEKSRGMDRRGFFRLGAATAVAIGATSLLAACAPAQAEKPPVTAPSTDPGEPSPSKGNPVETPAENPELFPDLTPEAIYGMTSKEIVEATRVPKGTTVEQYAKEYYPELMSKLLSSMGSQANLAKWRADTGKEYDSPEEFTDMIFKKITPALEQIVGDFNPRSTEGLHNSATRSFILLAAAEQSLPVPDYTEKYTTTDFNQTSPSSATFGLTKHSSITEDIALMLRNSGVNDTIEALNPGRYQVIVKDYHYDDSAKTMVAGYIVEKAPGKY